MPSNSSSFDLEKESIYFSVAEKRGRKLRLIKADESVDINKSRITDASVVLILDNGRTVRLPLLEIKYKVNGGFWGQIADLHPALALAIRAPRQYKFAALALIAVVTLISELFYRAQVSNDLQSLTAFESRWDPDNDIARSTAKIALSAPVMKLREHEEKLTNWNMRGCAKEPLRLLKKYVRATIEGYTSFMRDSPYSSEQIMSSEYLTNYSTKKAACSARVGFVATTSK